MKRRLGLTVVLVIATAIGIVAVRPHAVFASCTASFLRSNDQYVTGTTGNGVTAYVALFRDTDCTYTVTTTNCTDGRTLGPYTMAVNFYDYTAGVTVDGASESEPGLGLNQCSANTYPLLEITEANPIHGSDVVKAYGGIEGYPYVYTATYTP